MLTNYFFLVVAFGTMLLGLVSGVVSTTIVLEKQSQLGDAIGHSVYPGVILAFMLFQTRETIILLLGASVAGLVAFAFIRWIQKHTSFAYESILALILSSFFSLGLLLYSIVQNNPRFQTVNFAGLDNYIMGQAAYLLTSDVIIIACVSIIILIAFWLLYPRIKLVLFDKTFAQSIGINTQLISGILLLMCLGVIVIGLKAVGARLISSMLIAPAVTGLQWSNDYPKVILISSIVGMISSFIGTYLSTTIENLATGPVIIIVLSLITIFSIIFSPTGLLNQWLTSKEVR